MDFDLLAKDAQAMQDDLKYYAYINGLRIQCTLCEPNSKEREFLNNTKQVQFSKTLSFLVQNLPNQQLLQIDDTLTFNDIEYRIMSIDESVDLIEQRVILGKKYN